MRDHIVLGLNCSHDAAACIAVDGRVVCAVSEERLTRRKHCAGYPALSVEYCLTQAARVGAGEHPDCVIINQLPPADHEREVAARFAGLPTERILVNPSHHLLHAWYARMLGPDEELVVLVVDGSGYAYAEHKDRDSPLLGGAPRRHDMCEALSAYHVSASGEMTLLLKDWGEWRHWELRFPSLGHMYGLAAHRIFGSWEHAGKVMGLAPFGAPGTLDLPTIIGLTDQGIDVNTDWIVDVPPVPFSEHFEESRLARNLAATVQAELERGMWHLAKMLFERTGCRSFAISGGVALNSVFNGQLIANGPFDRVYATPAAHDAGTAIGAVAYGFHKLTGAVASFGDDIEFLGRCYSAEEIDAAVNACPDVILETPDDPVAAAARELAAGRIIGWFEGGSEFGPRALGHRSILADPRVSSIKTQLNAEIKFRERFRPYAAAVLREHCAEWFDDIASPHMLAVSRVQAERAALIPAVVHVDGTCRLQTVASDYRGSLRPLLEAFHALTDVPVLLNTSLNTHGQPLCETPEDALQCLLRSGLETLYCGRYRITKRTYDISKSAAGLMVVPGDQYRLVISEPGENDRAERRLSWIEQTNRRIYLSDLERTILLKVGSGLSADALFAQFSDVDRSRMERHLLGLCARGVLCLQDQRVTAVRGTQAYTSQES